MHTCSHDANSLVFPVHKADTGDLLSDLLLLLPWALTGGRPAVSLLAAGSSDPPSSLNSLITQKLFWTSLWFIWQRHVQMILWKWEEHLHVCKLIPATEAVLNEADASCSVYLVLSPFFSFSFTSSPAAHMAAPPWARFLSHFHFYIVGSLSYSTVKFL